MLKLIKIFLSITLLVYLAGCEMEGSTKKDHLEEDGHDQQTEQIEMKSDDLKPEKLELPDHLLSTLRLEMQQIDSGMGNLLSALAQGNSEEAIKVAEHLHNTYILKQRLSKADLNQLISILPAHFVKLDRGFHGNAKKIAEAVKQNDFKTAINLYGEMSEACVTCHQQYAPTRFPNLDN